MLTFISYKIVNFDQTENAVYIYIYRYKMTAGIIQDIMIVVF